MKKVDMKDGAVALEMWTCKNCGRHNYPSRMYCPGCGRSRQTGVEDEKQCRKNHPGWLESGR